MPWTQDCAVRALGRHPRVWEIRLGASSPLPSKQRWGTIRLLALGLTLGTLLTGLSGLSLLTRTRRRWTPIPFQAL